MFGQHARLVLGVALLGGAVATAAAPPACRRDVYGDPLPPGAVARMGTVRWRGPVYKPTLVPGGKYLATIGASSVILWDLGTGRRARTIRSTTHDEEETPFSAGIAFTSDGRRVATGSCRPSKGLLNPPPPRLQLWDVVRGNLLTASKPLADDPASLAVRGDGTRVAYGTLSGAVMLWDPARDKPRTLHRAKEESAVAYHLAFSPDGKHLTAVYQHEEFEVRRFDLRTNKTLRTFRTGQPARVALAPGGGAVATFTYPDQLFLYDVPTGKRRRLRLPGADVFPDLSFGEDGRVLLAWDRSHETVYLWDVAAARLRRRLRLPGLRRTDEQVPMLLPRDGTTLITSEAEEAIRLWDARTGKPRDTSGCPVLVPSQLAFSPDGRKLIAYSRRGTVYHWQTATGKLLSRTRLAGEGDDRDESRRRFLACGGQYVAEILPEGLDLFDSRHGKRRRLGAGEGKVTTLAFSPDGRTLAAAGADRVVRLWDVATGKLLRRLSSGEKVKAFSWVCFMPDGRRLATGESWHTIRLWDVASGKHLDTLRAPAGRKPFERIQVRVEPSLGIDWHFCCSPDGRCLALSSYTNLWVWDLKARREAGPVEELDHDGRVVGTGPVSVSPDGRLLAWFDSGFVLCVYELASGKIVRSFESARGPCAFAPAGWQLAVPCAEDNGTLLWDFPELFRSLPLPPGTAETPEGLWPLLAGTDAPLAHRALWRLAARPGVEDFLARRLPVVRDLPPARVAALLGELAGPDGARRTKAEADLARAREAVRDDLEKALRRAGDVEVRLRLKRLLAKLGPRSPEQLRDTRAVLVLEARGTPQARPLLRRLAGGLSRARLTREAREALARLEGKP